MTFFLCEIETFTYNNLLQINSTKVKVLEEATLPKHIDFEGNTRIISHNVLEWGNKDNNFSDKSEERNLLD